MKRLVFIFSTLVTSFFVTTAIAAPVKSKASVTRDRIEDLIIQIEDIAYNAQGVYDSDDNDPAVRAKLDPLVDELVSLVPKRTEAEKLPDVLGVWYQVWSDGPGAPKGQGALADSIYQVVFPEGYYWNIGRDQFGQTKSMGFLRGKFTVADDALQIEFTKAVTNPEWLFSSPISLAMKAELGVFNDSPPGTAPIGKKGFLQNVYVDEYIRICRGGGDEFGGTYLYILERD